MTGKRTLLLLLGLFILLGGTPARAEGPEQTAQRLLKQGRALLQKGDYQQAVIVLMQAQGTFPSSEIQLEIAAAYEGLGSLVDAARLYEQLLAGGALFGKDKERCEQRIEALRQQLGRLTITCRVKDATVKVNGDEVGKTPLPTPVYVEPGDVTVLVENPAHKESREVSLAAGQHEKLHFELRDRPPPQSPPASGAQAPADLPPPTAAPPRAEPAGSGRRARPAQRPTPRRDEPTGGWLLGRRWTWIAAAGAVVAGAVGLGLGVSAYSEYSEYKDPETSVSRYPELEDSISAKSTAANVMYGVAGGLALTAVVLYVVEGRLAQTRSAAAPRWWAGAGPTTLTVGGRF